VATGANMEKNDDEGGHRSGEREKEKKHGRRIKKGQGYYEYFINSIYYDELFYQTVHKKRKKLLHL
jgi:hypothetical protein